MSTRLVSRHSSEHGAGGAGIPPLTIRINLDVVDAANPRLSSGLGNRGSGLKQYSRPLISRTSAELTGNEFGGEAFSTNDRPIHSRVSTLRPRLSSDVISDSSDNAPRRSPNISHRPLVNRRSGEYGSPRRLESSDNQRGFFLNQPGGQTEKFSPQKPASSPRPGPPDRFSSQRGLVSAESPRPGLPDRLSSQRGLVAPDSPRDVVRVVSSRALTSQVAEKYLQTIEQQRLLRDKAAKKEEQENLVAKKKTARRLLGSFSMYHVDGFLTEIDSAKLDEETRAAEARLSNLSARSFTPTGPSRKRAAPPARTGSLDDLDEEYEKGLMKLIERRSIMRAFLMWRTVVAYRSYMKAAQSKRLPMLPNIAFGRRRSRRPPAPKANLSRASRMSIVRRPSTEVPNMDDPHPEWFNMGSKLAMSEFQNHKHQLNLGRRNTRTSRKSIIEPSMGHARVRKSVFQSPSIPAPVPEHSAMNVSLSLDDPLPKPPKSPINASETQRKGPADVRKNAPPPTMAITVLKHPLGLERKMSWSKKGMVVIKNMFTSPGTKLLSRIPSKEKLFERKSSKEKIVT